MGRTLNRVAGVVSAAALATFVAAPVALAQETDTTTPETTTTTTSESATTTTAPSTSETTTPSTPVTTTGTTTAADPTTKVTKTTTPETTTTTAEPPADDYQDNTGAGFVGVGGEGVLVINCAAGAPGNLAAQYLSSTGGPDQDESDGRIWNYTVRVTELPAGTTTGKFSWTCNGVEGNGIVDFEQEQPPATSTSSTPTSTSAPASSTAPVTTATSTTTTAPGNAAPKAQVKVTPKGGIETGFGGTAR
ncbi:hypothetical protein [Amycolatopsis sp. NPDC051061]|uniref:hypothetical protein n=1 Tax=Amycolatopsis sp. NPDC051061 TaxID=3155042 RepID=UPI00342E4583